MSTNRRIRVSRAAESRRELLDILLHAGVRLLEGASHQLVKKHRFTATDRTGNEHRVTARCQFGGREQINGCGGEDSGCARGRDKESGVMSTNSVQTVDGRGEREREKMDIKLTT